MKDTHQQEATAEAVEGRAEDVNKLPQLWAAEQNWNLVHLSIGICYLMVKAIEPVAA